MNQVIEGRSDLMTRIELCVYIYVYDSNWILRKSYLRRVLWLGLRFMLGKNKDCRVVNESYLYFQNTYQYCF